MRRYNLSAPARYDLLGIRKYLAPAPRHIQVRIVASLRAGFHRAVDFPYSGILEPEYSSTSAGSVRSLLVYPYRIFYRAEASPIVIAAIIDGRQDIPSILGNRFESPP